MLFALFDAPVSYKFTRLKTFGMDIDIGANRTTTDIASSGVHSFEFGSCANHIHIIDNYTK